MQLRVSPDIAEAFEFEGLGFQDSARLKRSSLIQIIGDGSLIAATVITIVQAPTTIDGLIKMLKRWRAIKKVGSPDTLEIHGQGVKATIRIDSDEAVTQAATALLDLINNRQSNAPHGGDDAL